MVLFVSFFGGISPLKSSGYSWTNNAGCSLVCTLATPVTPLRGESWVKTQCTVQGPMLVLCAKARSAGVALWNVTRCCLPVQWLRLLLPVCLGSSIGRRNACRWIPVPWHVVWL